MINPLLETRMAQLQEALKKLAAATDESLQTILNGLTVDTRTARPGLADVSGLARDARESCLLLVAREHPKASDLKYVMAVLRVGHDYERINELCKTLYGRIGLLHGTPMQNAVREMMGVIADIIELHVVVRKTWQRDRTDSVLPSLKAQVAGLAAAIHARIAAAQNRIVEIPGVGLSPEMFVELVLSCRHIKRITNLMELIPDELSAFDNISASLPRDPGFVHDPNF